MDFSKEWNKPIGYNTEGRMVTLKEAVDWGARLRNLRIRRGEDPETGKVTMDKTAEEKKKKMEFKPWQKYTMAGVAGVAAAAQGLKAYQAFNKEGEAFERGFMKAATDYGLDPITAVGMLKVANAAGAIAGGAAGALGGGLGGALDGGLYGLPIGGIVGAIQEANKPEKEKRDYLGGTLRGAGKGGLIGAGVGGGLGALGGGTLGALGGSMVGDAAQLTLDDLKAFGLRPDPNIPLNAPLQ